VRIKERELSERCKIPRTALRNIGEILHEERMKRGWSSYETARVAGVSKQGIILAETGEVSLSRMVGLLKVFGFSVSLVVERDGERKEISL